MTRAVEREYPELLPGPGPKRDPDTNCYKFTTIINKTNRRLTEKQLRAYWFLQPAFVNGKILVERTTGCEWFQSYGT